MTSGTSVGVGCGAATAGKAAVATGEEKRETVTVPLTSPAGSWRSYGTLYFVMGAKFWPQMLSYGG